MAGGRARPRCEDALISQPDQLRRARREAVFPVVHLEYALSEIEYFGSVVDSPGNVELAYDGYLLGHARWAGRPEGAGFLGHLRQHLT